MVSSFGITALDSRESKEIDLYSDYIKNKLQVLTLAAITLFELVYRVEIRLTMFTMNWQINQGIVLSLQSFAHSCVNAVSLKKTATILFTSTAS